MVQKQTKIVNKLGLHLRAAALLVQTACNFQCEVDLKKGNQTVNAKSIMGVMSLAASMGTVLTITCKGQDEESALSSLLALIQNKFNEPA